MKKHIIIRIIIGAVVLALLAAAYVWLWLPRQEQVLAALSSASPTPAPLRYQTARLQTARLAAEVAATGSIRSAQSTTLSWMTSGTISSVNGVVGQAVTQGERLAELKQTSLPAAVILAQADLATAEKALENLLASNQARAAAQMALVKAEKALDDAEENRQNKLYQRASQETIDLARARLIEANDALDNAEAIFDRVSGHDQDDPVYAAGLSQLARARQNQILADYNLDYVMGLPDPLDIEEADAAIAVASANLLQAKLDWERVKGGPNEQDVSAAEARVAAAQAALNMAFIEAPFAGTLTLVNSQPGDQIAPGTLAFQVDDLSRLYVDVSISEDDIARLKVGQAASVSLDGLPGQAWQGQVTEIGLTGKNTAGTVNFTVTVEVLAPGPDVHPGMSAAVHIQVSESQKLLFAPTRAVQVRDGQAVIFKVEDGLPAAVSVETGQRSGDYTALSSSELHEGDLVILNPAGLK